MTAAMRFLPAELTILFQPIVAHDSGEFFVHAFEGLTRGPQGTNFATAPVLFEYARRKNIESEIDRVCVARILAEAAPLPSNAAIAVNVHASTISRGDDFVPMFLALAEANRIPTERIIVEVIEHGAPWSVEAFHREVAQLRLLGVRLAIDDVGIGASNIKMLIDCRPDILKIDRYFVHGCSTDRYRRTVIGALAQMAEESGIEILAEGIENDSDLSVLLSLGIELYQGYLFSHPHPASMFAGAETGTVHSPKCEASRNTCRFRLGKERHENA